MQSTAARAKATIQAFHARVAAAEQEWHETQITQAEQDFQDMYTPCTSTSLFHDLQCGHRIQTEYTASCGILCTRPVRGYPFLCPTCLIEVVRAEVALESLTLRMSDDAAMAGDDPPQEKKVRDVADNYVREMIKRGYRSCKAVSKLEEPRLQFFDQFLREDGYGGVEAGAGAEGLERPQKRPGGASHKKKEPRIDEHTDLPTPSAGIRSLRSYASEISTDKADDARFRIHQGANSNTHTPHCGHDVKVALLDHSENSYTELPPEDEATEAVRKAMEKFVIAL